MVKLITKHAAGVHPLLQSCDQTQRFASTNTTSLHSSVTSCFRVVLSGASIPMGQGGHVPPIFGQGGHYHECPPPQYF